MGVELGAQGARSKRPQMYWKPVLRPAGRARDVHGKPITGCALSCMRVSATTARTGPSTLAMHLISS
eukprot:3789549-Pyramimonas_sp.AAC.1